MDVMHFFDRVVAVFGLRELLLLCVVFVPLERLLALRAQQAIFRKWWWNDLLYFAFNRLLIKAALGAAVAGTMVGARWLIPAEVRGAVAGQPHWLQLIEVIVLADLGFYAAHRAFHTVPFLWKIHAIHHSIEEMDWLAGLRVHPIDQVITKGVSILPLFALGFSMTPIIIFSWIYYWHSFLLHANVRISFGPLRWLIASPIFHHWHHANQPEAHNRNYAAQLPLLDILFGTMHMPKGQAPQKYGIDDPVPHTYFAHMAYPFAPKEPSLDEAPVTDGDAPRAEMNFPPPVSSAAVAPHAGQLSANS